MKNLDAIPKDFKEPDPYLDESVHIALDLAHAEASQPAAPPAG
ncbi:hypothetical protein [Candidatus Sodalis sp. SoCistrobi]|nr:hypothetical protein [Candidatus Sodalis sp. SoCistrobi]